MTDNTYGIKICREKSRTINRVIVDIDKVNLGNCEDNNIEDIKNKLIRMIERRFDDYVVNKVYG